MPDDLVDWADVDAIGAMVARENTTIGVFEAIRILSWLESRHSRAVHAETARKIRKAYAAGLAAGLADGAPKTCETCRRWKRAEYCSLNPEPLRSRTYCDRDYLTRAPGEFCSDHEPREP